MWCTATPSQHFNQQQRASSRTRGSCILHRSGLIHDPWPFISDPSPLQDPGVTRTGRVRTAHCHGLYGSSSIPLVAVSPWRLVSSGLAWCVHRLVSPRALRPMSCRANPSWSCHHHKGTVLSAAWRRAHSASRATCRQHMRACPLLDLAYGRTPVRPAAEAPRASCSSAAVCGCRVHDTHKTHNTVLLTLLIVQVQ